MYLNLTSNIYVYYNLRVPTWIIRIIRLISLDLLFLVWP